MVETRGGALLATTVATVAASPGVIAPPASAKVTTGIAAGCVQYRAAAPSGASSTALRVKASDSPASSAAAVSVALLREPARRPAGWPAGLILSWSVVHIFEPHAALRLQALPRSFDPAHKAWVVFKAIVEPVIFRLEADQHPRRLTMARDDERSSLSRDRGTWLIRELRTAPAISQPPI